MPFPWFQRQHALHPLIRFPPIHKDASTIRTSAGYATYLQEFLLANLAAEKPIYLDLHAVVGRMHSGVAAAVVSSPEHLFILPIRTTKRSLRTVATVM